MRRRTVLSGLAVALPITLAGCTGGSGGEEPSETEPPKDDETATIGRITASLTPREECPEPGEATVSFGDESISVVGCVVGNNGCNVVRLEDIDYDTDAEEVRVVVAAVEEREEDEACTEALVNLGYEVAVDSEGTVVTSVRVVHDDVNGRRTVADVTK